MEFTNERLAWHLLAAVVLSCTLLLLVTFVSDSAINKDFCCGPSLSLTHSLSHNSSELQPLMACPENAIQICHKILHLVSVFSV